MAAFITDSINFPNLTTKVTPTTSDILLIADAAASNASKQVTVGSLPFAPSSLTVPVTPTNGGTGVSNPTAHTIPVAEGSSNFTFLALTNGQLLIGSTGADPVPATPTATGATWTTGAGTLALTITGGGIAWTDVTGTSAAMAVNHGYIADNAGLVTLTLPAAATIGDVIKITGKGAGGWKIAQNASQFINFGNAAASTTGVGGSIASTNQWDCCEVQCVTTNNGWVIRDAVGILTIV